MVKINGIEKTFVKKDCRFEGWEYNEDYYHDSGVNLFLTNGKKEYKVAVED